MSKINIEFTKAVAQALILIGKVPIPAGVTRLAISLAASNVADIDQFQVRSVIGHSEFTLVSAAGDMDATPVWPVIRASGDLTTLVKNTAGYIMLDVEGLTEVSVWAACAADGPTDVTAAFFG